VKRVLVLRAFDDAARTGEKLREMGFAPLIAPVLDVVATGAAAPPGDYDAALATSAKGVALCRFSLDLPLHAVGARAAALAEERGWRRGFCAETAAALAAGICTRNALPLRFLYLAGHDRKDELEAVLRKAGHEVVVVETYEARAAPALAQEALNAIAGDALAAALHFSRRSATIFIGLAGAAGLAEHLRKIPQFALSQDIAAELRRGLAIEPWVAAAPNEASLLALLAANIAP
jgi:uroporphyrinogen-III synthase